MTQNDLALTSFSQGGYLSATYLVEVLKSIKGDITRESVTEALQNMEPIENEMVGTPYEFGTGDSHNPNPAGFPLVLENGTWSNEIGRASRRERECQDGEVRVGA